MSSTLLDTLVRQTDAQPGQSPFATAIEGLTILREDQPTRPAPLIFKPALCVVVQGAKWAVFGDTRLEYRAGQALIVNIETPAFGCVAAASPSKPYLGLVIELDLAVLQEVMEKLGKQCDSTATPRFGIFVSDFDGALSDCVARLVRLLDVPEAIPVLHPGIMREMCYWLLAGPHGNEVARIAMANSQAQRVISAIHALRQHFAKPVPMEELALIAQMSPSALHRHFKALTSMTPLQYQKQLRLLEARRLMVADSANVETAAFEVGYESPSQFSREYSRMFGRPPRRDIALLRTGPTSASKSISVRVP